ncbi:MAG TPA: PilZ domain-containing protein [Oscillospiraceae bacterium]|nr:PilZ domain-containing protein [Oscillospiraceae bacterium]
MLPLSEQYLGSPCEIKSLSNEVILTGLLNDISDDCLQITNAPEKLPIIHCNTAVKLNIYNNALGFRVLVGTVYLSTAEFIRIVDVQTASDFEKRNFFRVKVNLQATAYLVHDDVQENTPVELFPITVSDLSLGGLAFKTDKDLQPDDHLVVKINIESQNMSLLCKLKRIIPSPDTNIGCGCEFIDNSGRQFDLLCRYIFDCQRQQIQGMRQIRLPDV